MKRPALSAKGLRNIEAMVDHFVANKSKFETILSSLAAYISTSTRLPSLIHSTKQRVKDADHLRNKLIRKSLEAKVHGQTADFSVENLFQRINGLAGFRIIHLHTKQIEAINRELLGVFDEQRWIIVEGPIAKTWDDENRGYFEGLKMETESSKNLYTSVHYVVQPNSRSELTCEIQVRTLMEEVWGEVDHTINYPEKSDAISCREQIKVLARMTSTCSRLVDSIFLSSTVAAGPEIIKPRPTRRAAKRGVSSGGL
jgi:ppGpp synthetase/RelA/SpoT-type nucleotidyltranferase